MKGEEKSMDTVLFFAVRALKLRILNLSAHSRVKRALTGFNPKVKSNKNAVEIFLFPKEKTNQSLHAEIFHKECEVSLSAVVTC